VIEEKKEEKNKLIPGQWADTEVHKKKRKKKVKDVEHLGPV
jgi:hypothetical protein